MDECLIHSQFFGGTEYRQLESRPDLLSGSDSSSSPTKKVEHFDLELPDGDVVRVNKRPGLDAFLKSVSSQYEVHVFTAAMSVYASPVLDVLDPSNTIFTHRYYRECCVYDEDLNVYVKDLTNLDLDHPMSRVVLVDNNPMSFLSQPSNGILVSNFYDDPEDATLGAVEGVLERIEGEEDVRGTLDNMFGLRDALRDVREKGPRR
jgi:Dullard-like phosphatase family protein